MNRIGMYLLLRKLSLKWLDCFLLDIGDQHRAHERKIKAIIDKYNNDFYMVDSDD